MQRWTRGFDRLAALSVWLGAALVLAALIITFTFEPSGDGDILEESLELALLLTPLLLCPVVLACWSRQDIPSSRVLASIGLIGTLAVPTGALFVPFAGSAAYGAIAWLLLGVGVWLVGVNWPYLRGVPLLRTILALCGTTAGVCWLITVGVFAAGTTVIPLHTPPMWAAHLMNILAIVMGVAFIGWAVGTGITLALLPRRTDKAPSVTV